MLGFVAFYLVPTIRGIYLSFTEYSVLGDPDLDRHQRTTRAIFKDELFWNAMAVTLQYVGLNIGFQTVIALGLALLMHRVAKSTLIRGALLLPFLMANVIVALLWFWMLDYQIGIVNEFINWIGLPRIAFFGSEQWAIPTIAGVNVWRHMGYTALLIFAGLQSIPSHVYEVASLDGASADPDLLEHHDAAAAPGAGAGPGGHRDRLLPGLRHRGSDHRRRPGQRLPRHPDVHLPEGLRLNPTSATPRPCPSFSSSFSPLWPSSR